MSLVEPIHSEAQADASTGAQGETLAQLQARLAQVESFSEQVSAAIDQLVNGMLELQAQPAVPTHMAEIGALQAKVRELEQQLNTERSCRDLADVSRMHAKSRSVVFVGNTYFGDNLKYAWLACRKAAAERGFECWFMPHTAEQEAIVRELGAPCLPQAWDQWSADHITTALGAAVVVTSDHLLHPNPYALALLAGARQLQLWHGVSIKEIGLRNLPPLKQMSPRIARVLRTAGHYAALVGTTAGGEAEWRRWFGFDRYAPLGYPRNDVLYREPGTDDLLNVDRNAYSRARKARERRQRVVLWAPTFRDANRTQWILEAGLAGIAQELKRAGDCLIVNLHPVEQPSVPELAKAFPHVCFVAPRTDIYPLLPQCDVLVTDYSSVMFDWLHLQRPVLLFRPDHADYTQRSRKLFDDKLQALPGPCVTNATELLATLARRDRLNPPQAQAARADLLVRWFDHADGGAAGRFVDLVAAEIDLARPYFGTPAAPANPVDSPLP
jgi:CDP-glycerol glycerophosphotransferase